MIKSQKIKKGNCTNCKACYSSCPVQAIYFENDEYGFEYPVINESKCIKCGLCKKNCSKINVTKKQKSLNTYAVQSKSWELMKKSSSGGVFAQLAEFILSHKGIVFGCTLYKENKDFVVKHIAITDKSELNKIQGSKYVQSDIGNCYKQARDYLEDGKQVLFSGTPCQIAGFKAFLNREYENLTCVDLSCEGVPNQKIFNDYVKFLEKNIIKHPVVDFKFRNKEKLGWGCTTTTTTTYKVGNKLRNYVDYNPSYSNLFINMATLRESCYNCNFAGEERISDITLADAWGINLEYPNIEQYGFELNKGISLVLVNTQKGQKLLENINTNKNINLFKIDINKLVKYNHPLRCSSVLTNNREHYLKIYKENDYATLDKIYAQENGYKRKKTLIEKLKNKFNRKHKIDCLLMTMYANSNYGSILTTYALQKVLKDLGYSSQIINYSKQQPFICKDFYFKYCSLTPLIENFKSLNKMTKTFIIGADNLINCKTDSFGYVTRNLFNFTSINKKRIMIAGSMGDWDGQLPEKQYKYFKALLKRFNYLSTREKHGKEIFKNAFNLNSDWLNDPIFYLDKKEYIKISEDSKMNYTGKIMQYILYPTKDTEEICNKISQNNNSDIARFEGNINAMQYSYFDKNVSVSDWLNAIINSKIIITDSFHCCAFALMFNKPFICLANSHAQLRFTNLFEKLGVKIPIINNINDLKENVTQYDIQKVNAEIYNIRKFAISKIKDAMQKKVTNINYMNELNVIFYNINFKNILQNIFSVNNEYSNNKKRKVITILFLKIKFKIKSN